MRETAWTEIGNLTIKLRDNGEVLVFSPDGYQKLNVENLNKEIAEQLLALPWEKMDGQLEGAKSEARPD